MRLEEDIYIKTAEDTGHSVELVKFVVKNFWETVHFWLRNPLAACRKVMVTDSIKFSIRPYKVGYMIGGVEDTIEQIGENEYLTAKLYYLNEVAKQLIEYEGSARGQIENGRRSSKARRQRNREKREDNSA